jgi:tetratricopeptide (TPR) repeat protein
MANAKLCADKAFASPASDMRPCEDALDVYTLLGDYKKALSVMKASRDSSFRDYAFFDGVYRYAHHDSTWKKRLQEYVAQFHTIPDSNVRYMAAKYMLDKEFKGSYKNLFDLLGYSNSQFFIAQINDRMIHDYRDSIWPTLLLAERMGIGHHYAKEIEAYESLGSRRMVPETQLSYQIDYAFALYRTGMYAKSIEQWTELKPVYEWLGEVATYFIGRCYMKSGNKEKAIENLRAIVDKDTNSKYTEWSKELLEKLGQK